MAIESLPAKEIFGFIVQDFESAWNALVARDGEHKGGGNFMFALLAMILLEFACRVCKGDKSGCKLRELANSLKAIESRYFTDLPGTSYAPSDFKLPGDKPESHLLALLFNLVRNGKAHQYQSAIVNTSDGKIDIDITGAAWNRGLACDGRTRSPEHLGFKSPAPGELSIYVRTDQLFLDLKQAIEDSGIISDAETVTDISLMRSGWTVAQIEQALNEGGHMKRDL